MQFSRMILGTVQFGMDYGVANRSGQPGFEEVCAILRYACDGGVNTLDTAAAYGSSEEVLGRALARLGLRERVRVVSKVPPIQERSDLATERFIEKCVLRSLRLLGVEQLAVCLLHCEEDIRFLPLLEKQVQRGLVGGAGVSLDSARFLKEAAKIPFLQLPCNIMDRRFEALWASAVENKLTVFARSIYLQGLLLMPESRIKPSFAPLVAIRRQLAELASEAGMGMAELCVRYVLSNPAVSALLSGVEDVTQLRENLRLLARGPLPAELLARVEKIIPELPEALVRPALWE